MIVAGIVLAATGYTRADVIASIAIGLFILPRARSLLREVVHILLEATPQSLDLDKVRDHIREVPGIVDVHDLHAWTITSGISALFAHVVVDEERIDQRRPGDILNALDDCLGAHFSMEHCTFQVEPVGHRPHAGAHHE